MTLGRDDAALTDLNIVPEPLSSIVYADRGAQFPITRPSRDVYIQDWVLISQAARDYFRQLNDDNPIGTPFFMIFDPVNAPGDMIYGFLRNDIDISMGADKGIREATVEFAEVLP